LLRIGLTGGIASGKSEVSKLFAKRNVQIIDADKIARDLFKPGSLLLTDIKEKFGTSVFNSENELDRKALGNIVFSSPELLKWLNDFSHPKIAKEIQEQLAQTTSPYVVLDIPLLIKKDGSVPTHLLNLIDRILVVDVDINLQIERVTKRDSTNKAQVIKIIDSQSSQTQKLALADDVIDNNGTLSQLESQVEVLHNQYIKMTKS